MPNEVYMGAVSEGVQGAATGAKVGGAFGGGYGAAIGAIIGGAIGTTVGAFGGSKARKARKYAKKAAAIQQQREKNETYALMLQQIREGRITRASSLASSSALGIATSSLSTSALSSIGSQLGYNLQYTAEDSRLYDMYKLYMKKAGKAAQKYQTIMAFGNLAKSVANGVADAKLDGAFGGSKNTSEWAGISDDITNMQMGMSFAQAGFTS